MELKEGSRGPRGGRDKGNVLLDEASFLAFAPASPVPALNRAAAAELVVLDNPSFTGPLRGMVPNSSNSRF